MIANGRTLAGFALIAFVGLAPLSARADDDAGILAQLTRCAKAAGGAGDVMACTSNFIQSVKNSIPTDALPNPLPGQYYNNLEDQEGKMMQRIADPNDMGDPDVRTAPANPDNGN